MNKQPFYHRIDGLLFTSTTGFAKSEFVTAFVEFSKSKKAKQLGIIAETVEIEDYMEPEAGDPSDLL